MPNNIALFELVILWFGFWGIYNFWMMPKKFLTETNSGVTAIFFGIFAMLSVIMGHNRQMLRDGGWYGLIFLGCITSGLTLNSKNSGRMANSLFQMMWLASVFEVAGNSLKLTALVFWITHWPLAGLKHLKWWSKGLMIGFSALGGLLFVIILKGIDYPFNIMMIVALHLSFYWLLRPLDRKYQMNIVN